jgi:outer membrane protein, multidrug efflux system
MKHRSSLLPSLLAVALAGCSLAPPYERPAIDMPTAFKEAPPSSPVDAAGTTQWKAAQPADDVARGQWWRVFGDDRLDALEDEAQASNQDLKAAAARVAQARALQQGARSQYFPQIGIGFGPTRERPSPASLGLEDNAPTSAFTLWRAQATVSYEADLFGRVTSAVNAATFTAQRSDALFYSVRLSLQADVAQGYFQIRELDAARALYSSTVSLRLQTLSLVQKRFDAGDISELDVARAKSEVAQAQSDLLGATRARATSEHALAILVGKAPADFSVPELPLQPVAVSIPPGLPSSLLERRPDIAAAERAMAATNARIGIARAAFFPDLSITGNLGFESAALGNLFNWSTRTFLFGPLVGTILSMPIFDGGRRDADLANVRALYEEDVAGYRQTVLNAFREVEDNLADLRILADQIQAQNDAVRASTRASDLSHIQYREGSVSYLDVIDADRSVLQQQRAAVQLQGARARSAVGLIRAIGGGWDQATNPLAATPADGTGKAMVAQQTR